MKKIFGIIFMLFIIGASAVCFASEAPELVFTPQEGGKYIYSNNREFIFRSDLADNSNREPRYIMSNEDLKPDKYTLFASHVNHTEERGYWGELMGRGFDIELDVIFKAKENTVITVSALGFEVPDNVRFYIDGEEYTDERDWGCFSAWASYLGTEIGQLDSDISYPPVPFKPVTFEIKAGESRWLSEFIPNYREVPLWRPVHIISDFEIVSGSADVNVAAVRSTGSLGDRSRVSPSVAFGSFVPQYEMKGIAASKNQVDAYLSYTLDNSSQNARLPVTVFNQYAPSGKEVTTWFTNLNPTSDVWNKDNVAESCMLAFEYKDESKKKYYGKGVKESDKDSIWHFDTTHALATEYAKELGYTKRNFVPNFEITKYVPEDYCNSLGNYGVLQNYHLTLTNASYTDLWFNYQLNTAANNLIILRDENGKIFNGYPLTKGKSSKKELDTLTNIKIPAQQTVKFTLTVILTTNHVGGMENSFFISDSPSVVTSYKSNRIYNVKDNTYTGKEYLKWADGKLYASYNKKDWEEKPLNPKTAKIFDSVWNEIKLTRTDSGYIANNVQYSGIPYYLVRDMYRDVWCFDENLNLISENKFGIYPTQSSGAFGKYYIKAGTNFISADGADWAVFNGNMNLPCYNYGKFAASMSGGEIVLSENGTDFYKVVYEKEKPLYIDSLGDVYYYIKGKSIYVSADGLYWSKTESPVQINKIGRYDNDILVNDEIVLEMPALDFNASAVKYEDKYLGFKDSPLNIGGVYFVPLRSFASLAALPLLWDAETKTATIVAGEKTFSFKDGAVYTAENETIYCDGIITLNGSMYVPMNILEEIKG